MECGGSRWRGRRWPPDEPRLRLHRRRFVCSGKARAACGLWQPDPLPHLRYRPPPEDLGSRGPVASAQAPPPILDTRTLLRQTLMEPCPNHHHQLAATPSFTRIPLGITTSFAQRKRPSTRRALKLRRISHGSRRSIRLRRPGRRERIGR